MGLCLFKTLKIKLFDIVKWEVIHFFNVTEFRNDKVENGTSDRHAEVMWSRAVDLLLQDRIVLKVFLDLFGFCFGLF